MDVKTAKNLFMTNLNKKTVFKYLYDQLTGNFLGFVIGASATGLVSQFFETRGLKNLWGLTAKRTVVDKDTFSNLEWIVSIVIGFMVFEIVTKVIKGNLENNFPKYKFSLFRWIIKMGLHRKLKTSTAWLTNERIVLFTAVHQGVRQAFNRYSKRA